jgi:hypothetical protein
MNKNSDEYGDYMMDEQEDRQLMEEYIKKNPNSKEAIYQRNEDARFEAECKKEEEAEWLYEKKEKERLKNLDACEASQEDFGFIPI